jgi:hypothetical protein
MEGHDSPVFPANVIDVDCLIDVADMSRGNFK